MKKWKLLFCSAFVCLAGCDLQQDWILSIPSFGDNSMLGNTESLQDQAKYAIEGIYNVVKGSEIFGDTIVLKKTRDKISFFGLKDGCYFITDAGSTGNQIMLEGYWRFARQNGTGLARFFINDAGDLVRGDTSVHQIVITGQYGYNLDIPQNSAEFHLIRKFSAKLRNDPFIIGAHRGGGRTSDRLPVSENTLDMLRYTEYFGSTGVELDVRLTRDKIPVLYHDDDLNIRLVQKGPLLGYIREYTYEQLKTFVRLIHGEEIPTLEDALQTILKETEIRSVWLDMKEPEALGIVLPIQQKVIAEASEMDRNLEILIGIPTPNVYDEFKKLENYRMIPSLCELGSAEARSVGSKIWAFRWTLGLLEDEVVQMHEQGIRCLVWTLDVPGFTEIYVSHGGSDPSRRYDGILTNYPSITAYYHYVRHNF